MRALIVYADAQEFNRRANFPKMKHMLETLGVKRVNVWYCTDNGANDLTAIAQDTDIVILKGAPSIPNYKGRVINIDNSHPESLDSDPTIPGELTHQQLKAIKRAVTKMHLINRLEEWRLVIFAIFASFALCVWGAIAIAKYYFN